MSQGCRPWRAALLAAGLVIALTASNLLIPRWDKDAPGTVPARLLFGSPALRASRVTQPSLGGAPLSAVRMAEPVAAFSSTGDAQLQLAAEKAAQQQGEGVLSWWTAACLGAGSLGATFVGLLRLMRRSPLAPAPAETELTPAVFNLYPWQQQELEYASQCFFPTDFVPVKLLSKAEYNHDSTVYDFELPRCTSLNLPACACVLLKAPGRGPDGEDAIRPYTPISDNSMMGKFRLLVKRYDNGAASQYLYGLNPGDQVEFKHIKFNIKAQYPFASARTISLLCAGTGITPMIQVLQKVLETPGDDREVVLMYGNKSPEDILMKDELEAWARRYPNRLKVVHVIGETPDATLPDGFASTEQYTAEPGWIDEAKIKKHCFAPAEDTSIFVCGLPIMYKLWCGDRMEPELEPGTLLDKLGYTTAMVEKM